MGRFTMRLIDRIQGTAGVALMCWGVLTSGSLHAQELSSLRISGATTVQPAAELAAALFESRHNFRPVVVGGGSGAGIRDVLSGESDIGMVSRALTADERRQVVPVTYGFDALAFIVNSANPVNAIRREQAQAIFTGRSSNWSAISDWDREIILISKEMGRATLDLFEGYAGLHHPDRRQAGSAGTISPASFEVASNLEGITLVGGLPNAIGYVSLGTAFSMIEAGMPIKVLTLDGVVPSQGSIVSGTYPILRELNFVVLEQNLERVRPFTELLFGDTVRAYVDGTGAVSVSP